MKHRFARVATLAVVAVSSGVAYWQFQDMNRALGLATKDADLELTAAEESVKAIQKVIDPHMNSAVVETGKNSSSIEFTFTSEVSALWPLDTAYEPVVVKRHNEIRAWKIDLDRSLVGAMEIGDQVNLYIPQTERRITITLNSIKQGRHSETRVATIDGSDGAYSAYFTLGKNTLYGGIETPEGVFHIEQDGAGDAIIYPGSEIRKNLDYSVSDAVVVSAAENDE